MSHSILSVKRRFSVLFLTLTAFAASAFAQTTLLNVSYDPTREFYQDFNAELASSSRMAALASKHGP
jgi:ABC-type sulfate transport system substrate-binding protein